MASGPALQKPVSCSVEPVYTKRHLQISDLVPSVHAVWYSRCSKDAISTRLPQLPSAVVVGLSTFHQRLQYSSIVLSIVRCEWAVSDGRHSEYCEVLGTCVLGCRAIINASVGIVGKYSE